jgi:hypothetical protein
MEVELPKRFESDDKLNKQGYIEIKKEKYSNKEDIAIPSIYAELEPETMEETNKGVPMYEEVPSDMIKTVKQSQEENGHTV